MNKTKQQGLTVMTQLIVIAILVLIGGVGYLWIERTPQQKTETLSDISKQEPKRVINSEPTPKKQKENCSSIDCLIELAKTCSTGEVVYNYSLPFPFDENATVNGKTYLKVEKNISNELCTLVQQSQGATISLSDKGRQIMIEQGQTQDQIDSQIKMISDSMNSDDVLKIVTTCTGTGSNIAIYLMNAKQGTFSSSCSGGIGETTCTFEPSLSCVSK